ncbi:hypothetical protein EYC80_003039 [Monilinia laxa]|uniref:Uncharacterized protein n=1 Tax=Monilinia laxa TaxID=61186 RepID=A0A5N6KCH4_MONLA|nr:hypothetical protein EYC80_003039 [Monilinia laxa]
MDGWMRRWMDGMDDGEKGEFGKKALYEFEIETETETDRRRLRLGTCQYTQKINLRKDPRKDLHLCTFRLPFKGSEAFTRGQSVVSTSQSPTIIYDHRSFSHPLGLLPRNKPKPIPPSIEDIFRFIALLFTLAQVLIGLLLTKI